MNTEYQICEGVDYRIASAQAKERIRELQELDNRTYPMTQQEIRVQELIESGLSPVDARRIELAEQANRRAETKLNIQNRQFGSRNSQANIRLGFSLLRVLKSFFR